MTKTPHSTCLDISASHGWIQGWIQSLETCVVVPCIVGDADTDLVPDSPSLENILDGESDVISGMLPWLSTEGQQPALGLFLLVMKCPKIEIMAKLFGEVQRSKLIWIWLRAFVRSALTAVIFDSKTSLISLPIVDLL
jgi:hypothetical protein